MEQQTSIDDRGRRGESLSKDIRKAVALNRKTPSSLETPQLLMNQPHTVDNKSPNNPLMTELEPYNEKAAMREWTGLYMALVKAGTTVHVLPSTYKLQDLPYVANLGIYLPHLKPDTVIISNFKSPPRKGEDKIGIKYFKDWNYAVHQPKTTWEGEADLKWLKGNTYIGGYGIRTDRKTYDWMADKFEMEICECKMLDEKLYHFDCMFFPVTEKKALAVTSAFDRADLKKLEKLVEIVPVPEEYEYNGWTNCVRIGNKIFHGEARTPSGEKAFNACIERLGYQPVSIDIGEFDKSGADLSCMIFHMNYVGRK